MLFKTQLALFIAGPTVHWVEISTLAYESNSTCCTKRLSVV